MPDSIDLLLLVPPMKPTLRPIDVIYPFFKVSKTSNKLVPLHIGLLSIAAYLRKEGFSCQYYDLCYFKGNLTLRETIANQLKKYNPSVVGLTSYTPNFNATLKAISIIKEINPNILVCVGGPHVTFLDKYSIEESDCKIDVVVRGEGEKTMRDIVYYHSKELLLEENVRGITTKKKQIPDQKLLSNKELNDLPPVAFDLVPKNERKNNIFIPLNATRGCSYRCTFCTNPPFWHHKVRFRAPEKVIEEILIAERLFPKRIIEFTDTILPYKINHFQKLVNQYNKLLNTPVSMALTRSNLADNERMQLMKTLLKDDGYVIIGIENGSPKVLELMNKPSWEVQIQALKNLRKFGLTSVPSWMVGFCGETISTMCQNLEKLNYLNTKELIDSIILFIWIPTPGTLPFQYPKNYGVKIHNYNWNYYDRAVFPPPYSLFDIETGKITLTNLQIWAYYLSMLFLQNSWTKRKELHKGKDIAISEFMKEISENQRSIYLSPISVSNIMIYEDLFDYI